MDKRGIPNKYRPIPFWSWNEKLDTAETARQIEMMEKAGIGGFFMHARGGLQTEYMGSEWFDNIQTGINEGNARNMEPWAYEVDFAHRDFERYGNDQERMYREISEVCRRMSQRLNIPLIPVGTTIQRIRETVLEFDYRNGGLSLCRDGRHLSKDYGRLAAAAAWFRALTGQDVRLSQFEAFDMRLVEPILAAVNSI